MLKTPRRFKFRKQQKGRLKGNAYTNTTLNQGSYGLKALSWSRLE